MIRQPPPSDSRRLYISALFPRSTQGFCSSSPSVDFRMISHEVRSDENAACDHCNTEQPAAFFSCARRKNKCVFNLQHSSWFWLLIRFGSWTHQNPTGPNKTQKDPEGPSTTHQDPVGPSRTQQDPVGSTKTQQDPARPSRTHNSKNSHHHRRLLQQPLLLMLWLRGGQVGDQY